MENQTIQKLNDKAWARWSALFIVAFTMMAVFCSAVRQHAEVEQRVGAFRAAQDDGTSPAAVSAVRACERLVLFTANGVCAIAAVTAFEVNGNTIDELCHTSCFLVIF